MQTTQIKVSTMAFKKKTDTKKKKGPKGKRARAKAKLDRQWGETVDESQLQKQQFRRGKNRLLQQHNDESPRRGNDAHGHNDDNDVKVYSCSEESDNEEGEALNLLLQSISKKSRNTKHVERTAQDDDDDDDDQASSDNESEMSIDDETEQQVEERDDDEEQSSASDDVVAGDDDASSEMDPFSSHFNCVPLSDAHLLERMKEVQQTVKVSVPFLDSFLELRLTEESKEEDAVTLFAYNRQVLQRGWKRSNATVLRGETKKQTFSALQSALYPSIATYRDAFVAGETREVSTVIYLLFITVIVFDKSLPLHPLYVYYQNRDAIHNLLVLHLLNHVLTSRGRIQRNNKKAKQEEEEESEKFRDQGFTRPTVLILLPTRGTCHTFFNKMLALLGDTANVDNIDRFEQEYGPPEIDEEEDEKKRQHKKQVIEAKGLEWQELFGEETNDDDDFKVGLSITPKTVFKGDGGVISVKLYSDFYRSDIIIASPLGLKLSLGGDDDESQDVDFLSSIEICLVAHSSVLLMQNWDHVNGVLECLNQLPKKNNDTDFGRVRNYLLAGQAAHWRQLIVCSSLCDPHIVSTFKRHAKSIAGRLKLQRRTPVEDASLCNVLVRVKQVFQRIPCSSFVNQGKDRLRFFEQRILPQIQNQKHTMLFIPSYFDFVSVRNLLLKKEIEFVSVTEYARASEVTRGRARFLQGIKPLMLYTGRAHFFQRHVIKGVRHLILYGLPEHGEFYSGLVNDLHAGLEREDDEDDMDMAAPLSCLSVFTKYDALALERIVGNEHCNRMIKGEKSTYMFCS